jgi:hypothetical protein
VAARRATSKHSLRGIGGRCGRAESLEYVCAHFEFWIGAADDPSLCSVNFHVRERYVGWPKADDSAARGPVDRFDSVRARGSTGHYHWQRCGVCPNESLTEFDMRTLTPLLALLAALFRSTVADAQSAFKWTLAGQRPPTTS